MSGYHGIKAQHVFHVGIGLFVGVGGHASMLFKWLYETIFPWIKEDLLTTNNMGDFFPSDWEYRSWPATVHKKRVAFNYKYDGDDMVAAWLLFRQLLTWVCINLGTRHWSPEDESRWFVISFFFLHFSFNLINISTWTSWQQILYTHSWIPVDDRGIIMSLASP